MIGESRDYAKQNGRIQGIDDRPIRLLLVEDRRGRFEPMADYLRRQVGIQIDATSDSGLLAGVRAIFDRPDVVLVSGDLVGFTAWDTVRLIKQVMRDVAVVVVGRGDESRWWLRHSQCPDAIAERPDDYAAVLDLIRSVHARTGSRAIAGSCMRLPPKPSDTH